MTLLATISRHKIHLDCPCGRVGVLEVADLLAAGRRDWRAADVTARSRCRGCGRRGQARATITWTAPEPEPPREDTPSDQPR